MWQLLLLLLSFSYSSNKSKPLISVIVCIYNMGEYLSECLDSILTQSMQDFEIIAVDDGSTDDSLVILKSYEKKDTRLKICSCSTNKGTFFAHKRGIQESSGQYIHFLDPDDTYSSKDSLKLMVETSIQSHAEIVDFSYEEFLTKKFSKEHSIISYTKATELQLNTSLSIIEGCWKYRLYDYTLPSKLFNSSVCKKAAEHMEDVHFIYAEDAFTYFLFAYYSNQYYRAVTPPIFDRRVGSGISTSQFLSLKQYQHIVDDTFTCERLFGSFLKAENITHQYDFIYQKYRPILHYHVERMDRLRKRDWPGGLMKLFNSWPIPQVVAQLGHTFPDKTVEIEEALKSLPFQESETKTWTKVGVFVEGIPIEGIGSLSRLCFHLFYCGIETLIIDSSSTISRHPVTNGLQVVHVSNELNSRLETLLEMVESSQIDGIIVFGYRSKEFFYDNLLLKYSKISSFHVLFHKSTHIMQLNLRKDQPCFDLNFTMGDKNLYLLPPVYHCIVQEGTRGYVSAVRNSLLPFDNCSDNFARDADIVKTSFWLFYLYIGYYSLIILQLVLLRTYCEIDFFSSTLK